VASELNNFVRVCKAFIDDTGVKTWEEAEEKFPSFSSAEASDQFTVGNTNKTINSNRRCTSKYLLKGFYTLQGQRNSVFSACCPMQVQIILQQYLTVWSTLKLSAFHM
jgi:hypothetical protein